MLPRPPASTAVGLVILLALSVGSAAAQVPVFPASWQGVWMVTTEVRDCDTGEIVDLSVAADTICAGETLAFDVEGVDVTCTGVVTDDTVAATCTGQATPFPNCEASFSSDVTGTRSGDSYAMDQKILVDLPQLCPFSDQCFDAFMTAERISDASTVCPPISSVEALSWGVIKVRYRAGSPPR